MNKQETHEAIWIMKAYCDGAEIQHGGPKHWRDFSHDSIPAWNWVGDRYRIKPKVREFWVCPETMTVLLPDQKDLSSDYQYIKVREVLE